MRSGPSCQHHVGAAPAWHNHDDDDGGGEPDQAILVLEAWAPRNHATEVHVPGTKRSPLLGAQRIGEVLERWQHYCHALLLLLCDVQSPSPTGSRRVSGHDRRITPDCDEIALQWGRSDRLAVHSIGRAGLMRLASLQPSSLTHYWVLWICTVQSTGNQHLCLVSTVCLPYLYSTCTLQTWNSVGVEGQFHGVHVTLLRSQSVVSPRF